MSTHRNDAVRISNSRFVLALVGATFFAGTASAEIINPFPGFFADDTGAVAITPANGFLSINFSDVLPISPQPTAFGLYYDGSDLNDPGNSAEIFDAADHNLGGDPQLALVDMIGGTVFDVDDGTLQDTFFGGGGDIGFWMMFESIVYYTDPTLNQGGTDHAAIFRNLNPQQSNDYIIAFEVLVQGELETITFDLIDAPMLPAPSIAWLFVAGVAGWSAASGARRRRA